MVFELFRSTGDFRISRVPFFTFLCNPSITIKELQEETGLSESGVKKIIRQLRADNMIQRIGGAKGGHWEIVKEEEV